MENQDMIFHSLMASYYFDRCLYLNALPFALDDTLLKESFHCQDKFDHHRKMGSKINIYRPFSWSDAT